jgi:hypothetical protein
MQLAILIQLSFESQAYILQHLGHQKGFFGQQGSLANYIVSILAANADTLIQLSGKPKPTIFNILAAMEDSLVSWAAKPAIQAASWHAAILIQLSGKPSPIVNFLAASYAKYLQHLGIRCKYIQPLGSQEPSP